MIEPRRVLEPIDDAGDAIRQLTEYRTADELAGALASVWQAVEASLRRLLRADPEAPDEVRLIALSPDELPTERLLEALRRRDLISLALAGRVHEFKRVMERGGVHASDADLAIEIVDELKAEVGAHGAQPTETPPLVSGAAAVEPAGSQAPLPESEPRVRPFTIFAAAIALVALATFVIVLSRTLTDTMEEATTAYRAGDLVAAERLFHGIVDEAPENVTARLYLARIYRRERRYDEAAEQLRAAARIAPNDAGVRRELGHLFMDLGNPGSAADQYRRALEAEPDNVVGWVGLINALRASGDPSAEEVVRRAPPEVQSALSRRR